MKNSLNPIALDSRIDELESRRKTWEDGAYRTSNIELYSLLDACLTLVSDMRGNRPLITHLNAILASRNIAVRSDTSLAVKVVRLIFGDCGKRAYSYAKVLEVARIEKLETQSMMLWLTAKGGVENVLRSKPNQVSLTGIKNGNIAFAVDELSVPSPEASATISHPSFTPNSESGHKFCIALIRCDGSGAGTVVYATNRASLVDAVLADAGRELKPAAENAKKESARLNSLTKRQEIMSTLTV